MTSKELLEMANELRRLANNATGWIHVIDDESTRKEIYQAIDDLEAMGAKLRADAKTAMATQLVGLARTMLAAESKKKCLSVVVKADNAKAARAFCADLSKRYYGTEHGCSPHFKEELARLTRGEEVPFDPEDLAEAAYNSALECPVPGISVQETWYTPEG